MAKRYYHLGSVGPLGYDDADQYPDTVHHCALHTEQQIYLGTAPTLSQNVVRLTDMTTALTDYLTADGTTPLTGDWDIGNGRQILADQIRARNGDGLKLLEDGLNGITILDGGAVRVGDGTTNYLLIGADGSISFYGTSRIKWIKHTANSITVTLGSTGDTVSDLQTPYDGNIFDLQAAAATPGLDMYVEFTNVAAFNRVKILGYYDALATCSCAIYLYNWTTTTWNIYDSMNGVQLGLKCYNFITFDDTDYIGTGADAGKVRVRFYDSGPGDTAYHLYLDVVALYQ